jgi:uncharacterized protein YcbK (DUF882 family)
VNLSPHFTWEELTQTGQFALRDQNRVQAEPYRANLIRLATTLLEPVRAQFGPTRINSGFRCPAVNAAIGGSPTSQHLRGEAADLVPSGADLDTVMRWIVASSLPYGQAIREPTWIHLSLPGRGHHRQNLRFDGRVYSPW